MPKGDLAVPPEFDYQLIDRQGALMRDGRPTPGIFDAMGAYPDVGNGVQGRGDRTVLIRNHENPKSALNARGAPKLARSSDSAPRKAVSWCLMVDP